MCLLRYPNTVFIVYVSLEQKSYFDVFLVVCLPDMNEYMTIVECPKDYICNENFTCSKLNEPGNL